MTSTSIRLSTLPPDEAASNRLLRALWAELRKEFGQLFWQYAPRKYGSRREVYFGYADLGLNPATIRVGIRYKTRGIITEVLFCDAFDRIDLPTVRFESCVRRAETVTETRITLSGEIIVPYDLRFQSLDNGSQFSIVNTDDATYLRLRVGAFDDIDALHEVARRSKPILDVLSAFTNLFLACREFSDLLTSERIAMRPGPAVDLDWIDGFPVSNGMVVIPDACVSLIDEIIRDEMSAGTTRLVAACQHFHSARALEEQSHGIFAAQSEAELALMLYASCIEVLSLTDAPPSTPCATCGQPQLRISARATNVMESHHGPLVSQVFKDLYKARSKYLHTGRLLSSRSYRGSAVPQIDSSADDGNRWPVPIAPLLNLREWTSFCIRATVRRTLTPKH